MIASLTSALQTPKQLRIWVVSLPFLSFAIQIIEQTSWFNFDDSVVTPIDVNRISNEFGGSSESAYMLFYRRREPGAPDPNIGDPAAVCRLVIDVELTLVAQHLRVSSQLCSVPEIPAHLVPVLEEKNRRLHLAREERERALNTFELIIHNMSGFDVRGAHTLS